MLVILQILLYLTLFGAFAGAATLALAIHRFSQPIKAVRLLEKGQFIAGMRILEPYRRRGALIGFKRQSVQQIVERVVRQEMSVSNSHLRELLLTAVLEAFVLSDVLAGFKNVEVLPQLKEQTQEALDATFASLWSSCDRLSAIFRQPLDLHALDADIQKEIEGMQALVHSLQEYRKQLTTRALHTGGEKMREASQKLDGLAYSAEYLNQLNREI